MISKVKTLKLIKEKVDGRASRQIKLKKIIPTAIIEGIMKRTIRTRVVKLIKRGNSVMWVDDAYIIRNINVLDTQTLHKIMWQIITEGEKKEIALEHLVSTKSYLED